VRPPFEPAGAPPALPMPGAADPSGDDRARRGLRPGAPAEVLADARRPRPFIQPVRAMRELKRGPVTLRTRLATGVPLSGKCL